jgi:hypothetical protein
MDVDYVAHSRHMNPELNQTERYALYPCLGFEASAQSGSCALLSPRANIRPAVGDGNDHGFAWRPMPLQVRVFDLSHRPGQGLARGKLGWCGCATGLWADNR